MLTSRERFILRREPRYKVCPGREIRVIVDVASGSANQSHAAELIDLSRNGAKLSISSPLPEGETVQLSLQVPQVGFDWKIDTKVCWVRPRSAGQWWAGCVFTAEMAEVELQKLAEAGYLDQRIDPRQGVTVNLQARHELSSKSESVVRLENFSIGGFRIFSPEPAKIGQRLLLKLVGADGKPIEVSAEVRWQLESDGGQAIGCSFVNKNGYQLLKGAMNRLQLRPEKPIKPAHLVGPWIWAGLGAAVVVFVGSKLFF